MSARVVTAPDAPAYNAPGHRGVDAFRLQGREAGATDSFWVGLSIYRPGGIAETSAAREETVYIVVSGELILTSDGVETALQAGDSVHLPRGTVRSVENRTVEEARMLVTMAQPRPAT